MSSRGCVRTFPNQNKITIHNNQLKLNALNESVNNTGRKLSAISVPMATGKMRRVAAVQIGTGLSMPGPRRGAVGWYEVCDAHV